MQNNNVLAGVGKKIFTFCSYDDVSYTAYLDLTLVRFCQMDGMSEMGRCLYTIELSLSLCVCCRVFFCCLLVRYPHIYTQRSFGEHLNSSLECHTAFVVNNLFSVYYFSVFVNRFSSLKKKLSKHLEADILCGQFARFLTCDTEFLYIFSKYSYNVCLEPFVSSLLVKFIQKCNARPLPPFLVYCLCCMFHIRPIR